MADETEVRNKYSHFPVPLPFVKQMRFVELMARIAELQAVMHLLFAKKMDRIL